jgi:glycosyltransferase involved in cell wall biosynthesis
MPDVWMGNTDVTKSVRVCFISPKSYPLFNDKVTSVFGGAEVDAWLLATELATDERFAVSAIVADYGQPDAETRDGVRIMKGLDFSKSAMVNARHLWRTMKASNADVFFLESASPGIPFTALYCWMKDRRFVYRMASRLESDGTYVRQHPIFGRLFLWAIRKAACVIAQNDSDRMDLISLAGIESEVISNGQRIPSVVSKDKAGPILWVGRSDPVKRPDLFVELARRIPGERFTMICQCATGDAKYDQLKAEAASVSNLTFIERVPFRQVDEYFQRARVFVNTSDSEGFPNAFIQACKNGTAILSLSVNPDDFLTRYGCGAACRGDFRAMISQLKSILIGEGYLALGNKGRAYAQEKHDITRVIERYKEIFREVAVEEAP